MSASLVGSEMCIRDSNSPVSGEREPPGPRFGNGQARRSGASETSALAPVSYTHLTLPTICSV
eukprot:11642616-Alexandrium_andersonii.AAC.1